MIAVDTEAQQLAQRIRDLEHTLDEALAALDASASLRQREEARAAITTVLARRRTLKRSAF